MSWLAKCFEVKRPKKLTDAALIDKTYKHWRIRTLYAMYVGYACFYLTRKSYTFIIPQMLHDLHFTKTDIGMLSSIFYITYGISKFTSGMLSDRSNPRYFMAVGLLGTAIANLFFGLSSSLYCMAIFWLINAFFQGWGWPACARLLTHWYSRSERGTWWGIWNTSHNLGGALIPYIVAGSVLLFNNWRAAMFIPAIITTFITIFVLDRLRGIPESQGLPSIEEYRQDYAGGEEEAREQRGVLELFFTYVFKNRYIWILSFSSVLVYVIRTAINDWGATYLTENGYSLMLANSCVSFFEIGGFLGSFIAGWCSDRIFKGMRGQTNVLFSLGVIGLLLAFWNVPGQHFWLHSMLMFGIGFFVFGPQMLIGTAAAELSHREAGGTSTGFVGLFAYLGAAISGYPIGMLVHHYGWIGFFSCMVACAILSLLLLLMLWYAAGYKNTHVNAASSTTGAK